tara:strand:+ start:2059 stop:2532 length:474 start_codon:yes stop_codon:yes gene_type:complete
MYVEAIETFQKDKRIILEAIREPGNLNKFHPFCKINTVENWPGIGSIDNIEYLNGLKYKRRFKKWDDTGYELEIGKNRKLADVHWVVEGNMTKSSLSVRINPILPYKSKTKAWFMWHFYIKHKMQTYINNVLWGFKHYINTETTVERNKFGKHSWFS